MFTTTINQWARVNFCICRKKNISTRYHFNLPKLFAGWEVGLTEKKKEKKRKKKNNTLKKTVNVTRSQSFTLGTVK